MSYRQEIVGGYFLLARPVYIALYLENSTYMPIVTMEH